MSIKTLITSVPSDLYNTYVMLSNQLGRDKQEVIREIIYKAFKINPESQSELDALDRKLYKQQGCHLDEWLIEHIEDKIIKMYK